MYPQQYDKDDELTAPDLRIKIFDKFQVLASVSVIQRARRDLGWIASGPRYAQQVRRANRPKRVRYCASMMYQNEQFRYKCIFAYWSPAGGGWDL